MIIIDLPNNPVTKLQEKAFMKKLVWDEDAKFIKVDFSIRSFSDDGNEINKAIVPHRHYFLMASESKYRMPNGEKAILDIDEKTGNTIIPDGAVSEFEFFKKMNDMGNLVTTVINTQMAIKVQEEGTILN